MKSRRHLTADIAETIAIQALNFIAGDADRLGRFLAITGIGPTEIRAASGQPGFLAGVLEYLLADEHLVTEFANHAAIDPAEVGQAHLALGGAQWEREVP